MLLHALFATAAPDEIDVVLCPTFVRGFVQIEHEQSHNATGRCARHNACNVNSMASKPTSLSPLLGPRQPSKPHSCQIAEKSRTVRTRRR